MFCVMARAGGLFQWRQLVDVSVRQLVDVSVRQLVDVSVRQLVDVSVRQLVDVSVSVSEQLGGCFSEAAGVVCHEAAGDVVEAVMQLVDGSGQWWSVSEAAGGCVSEAVRQLVDVSVRQLVDVSVRQLVDVSVRQLVDVSVRQLVDVSVRQLVGCVSEAAGGCVSEASEDSEEDDACALSSRWAFQRDSKTWSRLQPQSDGVLTLRPSGSSDSVLSDMTSLTSDLSLSSLSLDVAQETTSPEFTTYGEATECDGDDSSSPPPSLRQKVKRSSRPFLRRMESLRRQKEAVDRGVSMETHPRVAKSPPEPGLPKRSVKGNGNSEDMEWRSRTRRHSSVDRSAADVKPQRACLYLEDYQLAWERSKLTNQRSHPGTFERVVHLPSDHKPGTFPRSLSIESMCPTAFYRRGERIGWPVDDGELSLDATSSCLSESQDFVLPTLGKRENSVDSINSVYDNVPDAFADSPEGPVQSSEDAFQHLDAILQHIHGLQDDID
ncbi:StAR-related lipid transfer protein 8 [Bagarius yarrelli]|uniref:StAR-related lipid transfer protein 8 n=1 Tax=Bagarius yarrelli TaxID=175774 RepID=A0A556VWD4_BAGYA|nr:StAR-related lipid transfer protein 8 [Bagarius yarrelli]